jgi:predicted RNA-binding Zn-ribbon protein involved in translation (DUF1610 family)
VILYLENNQRRYKKWKFPIILYVINRGGIDVMLIKCPECGKEISNKSEQCIHCGFPIRKSQAKNICKIGNVEYALTSILNRVLANESIYAIKELREMTNLGLKEAKDLCDTIKASKKVPYEYKYEDTAKSVFHTSSLPHCPTCGSTNIEKIGVLECGASVAILGLFSKKINKSFKCQNCGLQKGESDLRVTLFAIVALFPQWSNFV